MNPMHSLTDLRTALLSDTEIDELDDCLMSEVMPGNCMDISTLDGFFAALVLNPNIIMPSEYLPWIWDMEEGEEAPVFASPEQANHILQLVMRYYNGVLVTISNNDFAPLLYTLEQDDEGEAFDAEGWCMGFMQGVFLFVDPWKDVFESHPEFLAPMVLLGTQQGWDMLEKSSDVKLAMQDACESIAGTVAALYSHFREQRDAVRQGQISTHEQQSGLPESEVEISNARFRADLNNECPCGSGKRFEQCCGSPPVLH